MRVIFDIECQTPDYLVEQLAMSLTLKMFDIDTILINNKPYDLKHIRAKLYRKGIKDLK